MDTGFSRLRTESLVRLVADTSDGARSWALDLVEKNVRAYYGSEWRPRKKARELAMDGMQLVVALVDQHRAGFVSFRMETEPTMRDDGSEDIVLYCYELQVDEQYRGRGIGQQLMGVLERTARSIAESAQTSVSTLPPCNMIMLTSFKANEGAVRFYKDKLGFEEDERSPDKVLPPKRAAKYNYVILSKKLELGSVSSQLSS